MRFSLPARQQIKGLYRSLLARPGSRESRLASRLRSLSAREGLARIAAIYAGGKGISLLLRMAGGFLVARVTEPEVLGLFSGLALVLGYVPFMQMGVLNGLNRELPYYIGMGEHDLMSQMVGVAQLWAILVGGLLGAAMGVLALWYFVHGNTILAAGWFAQGLAAFALVYGQHYMQVTYRGRAHFGKLAAVNVVQNALAFLLVALVWLYGFYGLCLRAVLVALASLSLLWVWRPVRVRPSWNPKLWRHLVKVGAPILLVGQIYAWWSVLDSTLVLYYLKAAGLGDYQLAIIARSAMILLPTAVGEIVYQRMTEQFGRGSTIRVLIDGVKRPIMYLTLLAVLCLSAAWFSIPYLTLWLLPKYAGGISAAQWTLVAIVLSCLTPVNNVFNVVKRQDLYAAAIVTGMITYVAAVLWLTRQGAYLAAFPQAMAIGRVTFIAVSYLFLAWLCRREEVR